MNMDELAWPVARLGEAIEVLARRAGLDPLPAEAPGEPDCQDGDLPAIGHWIDWACGRVGVEAQAVDSPLADFGALLRGAGPALLWHGGGARPGILVLLKATPRTLHLIGPDLRPRRCPLERARQALCAGLEAPVAAEIDSLLAKAGVPERRRRRARTLLTRDRLSTQRQGGCWMLRLPAGANLWRHALRERLLRKMAWMLALFALGYGLEIAAWSLMGRGALDGRWDSGWFAAWTLLVLTLVPLELLGGWMNSMFALDAGRLLKQRLLAGALRMDTETIRRQGAGQLLGQVIESQALESLALNGGLAVLVAAVELGCAGWVLALGAGGGLLLGWLGFALWLGRRNYQRLRQWSEARLDMTHTLVERMVGHRTRLAQERPEQRNGREDRELENYLNLAGALDRSFVPIAGLVPGGWMLLGLAGLAPAFVAGGAPLDLAVALGGLLLAKRALGRASGGFAALGRAVVAWNRVSPLFRAAARTESRIAVVPPERSRGNRARPSSGALLEARDLLFRYRPLGEPVLRGGRLTIHPGDRILLEGDSGGGKSTLAALLVGLRQPESGLMLLDGLDRHTLGEDWRRYTAAAPQFHENHVLSGSFAFNLLMGREWPASEADLEEAESLCRELGLGDLLDRMPAGLMQRVGESGWQLSHGERSRLYLARALLQKADLTVLDESFAALDPENLEQCLVCALKRASTLLVIAHP